MTLVPISIEVRFLRIPTRWTVRKSAISGAWMFVPEVSQEMGRKLTPIDDAWELRNQFFRMKHDEKTALDFLDQVGVWDARVDARGSTAPADGMLLNGHFGHRLFSGKALPLTLEGLWRDKDHWNTLLRPENETHLRAEFGTPPAEDAPPFEKSIFASKAHFQNTLPLHLEWHREGPRAVIQPITGSELLIATTQVEIVSGAARQVCQRKDCGISFSGRRKTYCQWYCGHIESVRKHREKKRKGKHGKKR